MHVNEITTHVFDDGWERWLLVGVHTDEGLVGWGEGSVVGAFHACEAA